MKRLMLLLSFIFFALPLAALAKPVAVSKVKKKGPKLFVLAIGVNTYDDDFFPDLKWAERDAERFAKTVGVDIAREVDRRTLTGSSVSSETVRQAIDEIANVASGRDALLVYLSGHGSLVIGGSGDAEPVLVLPATTSKDLASTSLPIKSLIRWIERVPTRRRVLVTAACHSGVGKSRLTAAVKERLTQMKGDSELELASEGTIVLSAAARNEVAVEDNSLKSDLYTHYFLDALTVYDRNKDGAVSLLEAHDYATYKSFEASRGKQRPTIYAEAVGDVDFPLRGRRKRNAIPIFEGYTGTWSGAQVSVNQNQKGRLPFAFPLENGRNNIELYSEDGKELLGRFTVRARSGQTVTVDELFAGHPYSLGFYIGQAVPVGEAYAKVTGGSYQYPGVLAYYRWQRLELGLDLQANNEFAINALTGLELSATQSFFSVRPGAVLLKYRNFAVSSHLVIGYSTMDIIIKDEASGYQRTDADSTVSLGIAGGLSYDFFDVAILSLESGYQQTKHEFGGLGNIDASRRVNVFSARFTFGGVARRK